MKCKVQLYVAGQTFNEIVRAVDYQEARQVALARNPNATIVSVTAVLGNEIHLQFFVDTIYNNK